MAHPPKPAPVMRAQLMDLITPSPSAVNRNFWDTYKSAPEQAIADFYAQSKRNDYVKVKAIAQNIAYKAPTKYGDLETNNTVITTSWVIDATKITFIFHTKLAFWIIRSYRIFSCSDGFWIFFRF